MTVKMARELKYARMGKLLLDRSKMDTNMERVNLYGKMVPHLKENLNMTI